MLSVMREEITHIGGERRLEAECLPVDGMAEAERVGMQRLPGNIAEVRVIEEVAGQRMTEVEHVDADLMRASGLEPQADQGEIPRAVVFEKLQEAYGADAPLEVYAALHRDIPLIEQRRRDAESGSGALRGIVRFGERGEGRCGNRGEPSFQCFHRISAADREVLSPDFPRGERRTQHAGGKHVFRTDQQPAGIAIQAVDDTVDELLLSQTVMRIVAERVPETVAEVPLGGMNGKSRRLMDELDILILIDHVDWERTLRDILALVRFEQPHLEKVTAGEPVRGEDMLPVSCDAAAVREIRTLQMAQNMSGISLFTKKSPDADAVQAFRDLIAEDAKIRILHFALPFEAEAVPKSEPALILFGERKRGSVRKAVALCGGGACIVPAELRPANADLRIIPGEPALVARVVEVRDLVAEFCSIGEHEEAVREALGNIELLLIFRTELYAEILPVAGAFLPEIDGDVIDPSVDDPDELALRVLLLIMQPAQHALYGHALIVLHEDHIEPRFTEILLIVGLHEIAAFVSVHRRRNDVQALNRRLLYLDLSHISASFLFLMYKSSVMQANAL